MSEPNYTPHRKGTWVVGAVLLTVAVSGYFMGLQQTGSTLKRSEPVSAITPDSMRRAAAQTREVPVAVTYARQDWLRDGPNALWRSDLAALVAGSTGAPGVTNLSEAERAQARAERARRRAFDGAPPVVPHPIAQDSSAVCLACHGPGLAVKDRTASKISHPHYDSCTQCHVSAAGLGIEVSDPAWAEPLAENSFTDVLAPRRGLRAWTSAPPTIPHSTHMRGDCLSCHGPLGAFGIRTPHPERQACTQCHVPDAGLDQYDFLAASTFP